MNPLLLTEASSVLAALDSDEHEPLYVLFDSGVFEEFSAKPAIIDPVIASRDLDSITWLAESLSYPTTIAVIMPQGLVDCKLESAVQGAMLPSQSFAMSGFATVSGIMDPSHVFRLTPSDADIAESVADALEALTGAEWPSITKNRTNIGVSSWICRSKDARCAIALSDGHEVRPWKICTESELKNVETEALASWEIAGVDTFWRTTKNESWNAEDDLILEYARKSMGGTLRLKRVVMDALVANKELPGKLRTVSVSGNKMTIRVGKKTYWFTISRDSEGWVTGIQFDRPKGKESEIEFVKAAIAAAFKEASLHQVLEDACSEKQPKLVMLDYVLQDPSPTGHARRRTRMVEPYSFRRKYSKNRRYFYGWNVEEGGIRSYIVENIKGIRKTDIAFRPRFLVEIGVAKRLRSGIAYPIKRDVPATVSLSAVKRGHQRYELAGGRGKIIRRLGHSVAAPKPRTKTKKR